MELQKRQKFLINTLYLAVIIAIAFLVFKYLIGIIMPFFLAFLFASILRPAVRVVVKRFHFRKNIASILCTLLFFGLIGGLVVFIGIRLISLAADHFPKLPGLYKQYIEPGLQNLLTELEGFAERLDPAFMQTLNDASPQIVQAAGDFVSGLSGDALRWASAIAARLPTFLVGGVIMVIATFFMSLDYDRMTAFLMRLLPSGTKNMVMEIRKNFINIILRYGKSYSIILLITFAELSVGLLVIGVDNALIIALLIAVLDIFPVLGTGMVLGPWAVISFIQGSYLRAFSLIVIYLIITVVRQIAEPRIIGKHVGLHPLVTLICMYTGARLFGAVGFFGLPFTAAILHDLASAGTINLGFWKGAGQKSRKEAGASTPGVDGGDI